MVLIQMSSKMESSSSVFQRLRQKLSSHKKPSKNSLPPKGYSKDMQNSITITSTCSNNDIQKVFNYFDENKDGKISPAELQSCVKTVGGELSIEEAEAAVRSSDVDGDGMLGLEEFEQLMEASGEDEKACELKEAFDMYVMEGSGGVITPVSLKRMLSRLGESRSLDECKAMIRAFDLNGDEVLSFDEFRIMMR